MEILKRVENQFWFDLPFCPCNWSYYLVDTCFGVSVDTCLGLSEDTCLVLSLDTCLGLSVDTCLGLSVDTCLGLSVDTCLGLSVDTCLGLSVDTCLGLSVDTCLGLSVDTCLGLFYSRIKCFSRRVFCFNCYRLNNVFVRFWSQIQSCNYVLNFTLVYYSLLSASNPIF